MPAYEADGGGSTPPGSTQGWLAQWQSTRSTPAVRRFDSSAGYCGRTEADEESVCEAGDFPLTPSGYNEVMTHGDGSSIGRAPGCDPEDEEFEPPLSPQSLHWLAGLLEGEGSFLKPSPSSPTRPAISIEMTDKDVIERVSRLLGAGIYVVPTARRNSVWKPSYRVILRSNRAVQLMLQLKPLMGRRRQQQIEAAIAARNAALSTRRRSNYKLTPAQRRSIAERLDSGERAVDLAAEFGIAREYVYRAAKRGRTAA